MPAGTCRSMPCRTSAPASYANETCSSVTSPRTAAELDRVGRVGDVDGQVLVLEDPAEQRERRGHVDADVQQAHQRAEEGALERGEGDQRADGHPAGGRGQAGDQVDRGRDGGEDHGHGGHPPAAGEHRADLEVDQVVRGRGELLRHPLGGTQGAGQQRAADRQGLLDLDVEVGQPALPLGGDPVTQPRDAAGQPDRGREHQQGEQREPPRERGHRDGGADHDGHVGGDRGRGRGDHALHAVDVVGQPRLHLAAAGLREEADGLALEPVEEAGAQVVHDLLADRRREPGLEHADHRGRGGDGDHAADQPQQQVDVLLGEGVVDQALDEEGLREPDRGADHDQADHHGEPALEGREQAGDPAQGDGGVRELPHDQRGRDVMPRPPRRVMGEVIHVTTSILFVRYAEVTSS